MEALPTLSHASPICGDTVEFLFTLFRTSENESSIGVREIECSVIPADGLTNIISVCSSPLPLPRTVLSPSFCSAFFFFHFFVRTFVSRSLGPSSCVLIRIYSNVLASRRSLAARIRVSRSNIDGGWMREFIVCAGRTGAARRTGRAGTCVLSFNFETFSARRIATRNFRVSRCQNDLFDFKFFSSLCP